MAGRHAGAAAGAEGREAAHLPPGGGGRIAGSHRELSAHSDRGPGLEEPAVVQRADPRAGMAEAGGTGPALGREPRGHPEAVHRERLWPAQPEKADRRAANRLPPAALSPGAGGDHGPAVGREAPPGGDAHPVSRRAGHRLYPGGQPPDFRRRHPPGLPAGLQVRRDAGAGGPAAGGGQIHLRAVAGHGRRLLPGGHRPGGAEGLRSRGGGLDLRNGRAAGPPAGQGRGGGQRLHLPPVGQLPPALSAAHRGRAPQLHLHRHHQPRGVFNGRYREPPFLSHHLPGRRLRPVRPGGGGPCRHPPMLGRGIPAIPN